MSISNNNYYIYSVLSNQNITIQDLTIESVDRYFSDLLENVKNYILEQQFDIVFDLFEEMFSSELELRSNEDEPLVFNNMDYHKVLLYQVHSLQCRIIDLLICEIHDSYLDYLNIKQYSCYFADRMRIFTLAKFHDFCSKLIELKTFNKAVINRYFTMISEQLKMFD